MNRLSGLSLLSGFLLFSGPLMAERQDSTSRPGRKLFENQVGLNASNFILTFLNFGNPTFVAPSPFDLNYKFLVNTRGKTSFGLRAGIGYTDYSTSSENQGGTVSNSENQRLNFRVGGEMQVKINKSWVMYVGFDYTEQGSSIKTVYTYPSSAWGTVTNTYKNTSNGKGFGPLLGVQFNINRWMCLSTETTCYYMKGDGTYFYSSTIPGSIEQRRESRFRSLTAALPTFINFSFRF